MRLIRVFKFHDRNYSFQNCLVLAMIDSTSKHSGQARISVLCNTNDSFKKVARMIREGREVKRDTSRALNRSKLKSR